MAVGDISRLGAITAERSRAIRARVRGLGFAERTPLPAETAASGMPQELRLPLVKWALDRDQHPAAGLALLFEHLLPVPRAVADRALGTQMLGWLLEAGIVERAADAVRACLRLAVMDGVFIWCDDASAGAETVMSPGPTTLDLVAVLPSSMSGSVLDVGTGPGTLGLVAAKRGADRVVATDISDRAVALTRFN
ncbi:MAG: 50S ribosomal protein L11 methyltransferase, partial [Chloroflexota bacterium]